MTIYYLIPGLGCDVRVFQKFISLLNIDKKQIHCIEWQTPLFPSESLADYVLRLAKKLPLNDANNIIIGLSLGGMLATELAKIFPHKKLFIISSIKHQSERPLVLRWAKTIPIYHLIPTWLTVSLAPRLARWLKISDPDSSYLFGKMIKSMPKGHISWARQVAVNWENPDMPTNCIHIQGSKDHIFNNPLMQVDYTIEGATHNMILDRTLAVANIVNQEIKNILA